MKQYNHVITIEVPVDAIAKTLLDKISPDFKHREMLVESIIGPALDNGGLTYIYNALNGFNNEINFKEGDKVNCSSHERRSKLEGKGGAWIAIGECEVVEVDLYKTNKLKVKFTQDKSYGEGTEVREQWVPHTSCEKITLPTAAENVDKLSDLSEKPGDFVNDMIITKPIGPKSSEEIDLSFEEKVSPVKGYDPRKNDH